MNRSKSARPHAPQLLTRERHVEKPLSFLLGLGFTSHPEELFRNVAMFFGGSH
jgi:hypothetical protein